MFVLLNIFKLVVDGLHFFVHGGVPLLDDTHGFADAGVKAEDLLVLADQTVNYKVIPLVGQTSQENSFPLLHLLSIILGDGLETFGYV